MYASIKTASTFPVHALSNAVLLVHTTCLYSVLLHSKGDSEPLLAQFLQASQTLIHFRM